MAHSFLFWLFFSSLHSLCPGSKISWGFLFHLNAYLLPSKLYNGAWSVYRRSYKDSRPTETTSARVNMMGADVHTLMKRKGKRRASPFLTRLGSQRLFAWSNWSLLYKHHTQRHLFILRWKQSNAGSLQRMVLCPISHTDFPLSYLKGSTNPANTDFPVLKFTANNIHPLILKNPRTYCSNYNHLCP